MKTAGVTHLWLSMILLLGMSCAAPIPSPSADELSARLDDFHQAASDADFDRYFGHFASDAVFLGTDATERWTVDEFKTYAKARFDRGTGWTYTKTVRNIVVSEDGNTAWFDELLHNERYGQCRGTGVLVNEAGTWKVAQYHLTIPVPNALASEVVRMIRQPGN